MVESQHRVATLRLVDSLEEQRVLEDILERSKPPVPRECENLHYLMAAPFRYGRYPNASRFRRAGHSPGVFYTSEQARTAAMETAWYRLQFYRDSPGTSLPEHPEDYTAFCVRVAGQVADLTRPPLNANKKAWTDPDDYSACLDLADRVRRAGAGLIRYQSVRDPEYGANLAVLRCTAFAAPAPQEHQLWRILVRQAGAVIIRDWPRAAWEVHIQGSRLRIRAH